MIFTINVMGDAQNVVNNIEQSFNGLNQAVAKSRSAFEKFSDVSFKVNQVSQYVQGLQQSFNNAIQPGVNLNYALAELSAITGETGEGLKQIEKYARSSAKAFGVDASKSVESYKLILSQLSPEIAKVPEALSGMGTHIATLSKTMGGNVTAAAEVLTTAMNQYQVSLDDPMEATRIMGEMMNVMAAGAKVGSAELPAIQEALKNAGMTAKMAGVSFAETNAAIQVLDKAGKKGAEGGVALRNVMSTLGKGRFLPPDVQEELRAANIDISTLTDTSLSLEDRLKTLKPVMNDGALLTKLFGRESQAAAMALIAGTDKIGEWTEAIQGTNTAQEQAAIIMESYQEKLARVQARFDDIKISIFNATGDFGIWMQLLTNSLIPIAQIIPLLKGVGSMFMWIKTIQFATVMSSIKHAITGARISLAFMNRDLLTGQMINLGFIGNIVRSTIALGRFATVGVWSAIKGVGAYIISLVTGGAMSATFSAISSAAFTTFAITASAACKAVSVAIFSIPIIGWIALAVTAIGSLFVFLYKRVDKFRAVMNGIGAAIKALFTGDSVSEAYNNAYEQTLDEAARKRAEEADKEEAERLGMSVTDYKRVSSEAKQKGVSIDEYLAQNPAARFGIAPEGSPVLDENGVPQNIKQNTEAAVTGGTRNTNITMNVGSLVESITFTESLKSSAKELENLVYQQLTKALLSAQSVG